MEAIKQTFLTIGSMEVPINEIKEPVVIENLAHSTMLKVKLGVAANKDKSRGQQYGFQILPTKMVLTQISVHLL